MRGTIIMDYQLVESDYNKLTGKSFVKIKYKGKYYVGIAKLHPDDADKASKFAGCRFAEQRAVIKALKDELKQKRAACDECRKFVNAVTNYANFDPETPTAKAMFRQLNRRIKEVNNIIDEINATQEGLEKSIRQHTVVVNGIQSKKANQDKED